MKEMTAIVNCEDCYHSYTWSTLKMNATAIL